MLAVATAITATIAMPIISLFEFGVGVVVGEVSDGRAPL
jgi:hypothetical protein